MLKTTVTVLFVLMVNHQCTRAQFNIQTPLVIGNPLELVKNAMRKYHYQAATDENLHSLKRIKSSFLNNIDKAVVGDDNCSVDIQQVVTDFASKTLYARKMVDAWGKVESGILTLNFKWPGRYYECLDVTNVKSASSSFGGKYCTLSPTIVPMSMGSCVPSTCGEDDLRNYFKDINVTVNVKCSKPYTKYEAKEIIALVVSVIFGTLVVCSTLYDLISKSRATSSNHLLTSYVEQKSFSENHGKLHEAARAFSVAQNAKLLLSTAQKEGQINCLHGIRFLSMCWVVLGHSFVFMQSFTDNVYFAAKYYLDVWTFQAIGNATFSVDSFFFLSGLLVTYLGMREIVRRAGKINIPLMYLLRYIRLTPAYAFTLLFSISLWPMMAQGPYWNDTVDGMVYQCEKHWWTNLLYINSLYPGNPNTQCFGWGWYLSNDMLFFLLTPHILYLLYRYARAGVGVLVFLLVASMSITGSFSFHTKQQPMEVMYAQLFTYYAQYVQPPTFASTAEEQVDLSVAADEDYSWYMKDLYFKPYCRLGAYVVGILTGFVLHRYNNKLPMTKVVVVLGWIVAAITNLAIVYGLFGKVQLDLSTAAFYNAVSRPLWCVGLAWVVVACAGGNGGPVEALLSWKPFIPLGRLTYCAYLVHPLVIFYMLAGSEVNTHFAVSHTVLFFLGVLVITHLAAFLLSLLVEIPISTLVKIVTTPDARRYAPLTEGNGASSSSSDRSSANDSSAYLSTGGRPAVNDPAVAGDDPQSSSNA